MCMPAEAKAARSGESAGSGHTGGQGGGDELACRPAEILLRTAMHDKLKEAESTPSLPASYLLLLRLLSSVLEAWSSR